jgi:TP901 family phage tail tape measure protein
LASLAELMVKVGADISSFTKNMQKVDQTMQSTGKGMMKVGKSMTNVGTSMASSITAPLLGMGATAVIVGAKFDAQMSKVSAVSGATGKDFDKLRDQAKDLGSTTVWSATEAAQGMEFLARAGWDTEQIMSAMPSVLDLATASAIDLGTASDIASNIMSGFGASADEAQRYMDVLAKTTAKSNTDVNQLGDAMKYVSPVANTFGWSVEETAAAIGKMSDAGIQGSQAGTTLRAGLLRLASPAKEARVMMDELGMSFFDAEGKMKSMPDLVGEIAKGTKGMSDEQKAHTLSTIFGQEAVSGFLALMDVGKGTLGDFTGMLEDSEGTASDMAKTMGDNLAGSVKGLLSALEGLAISFSDVMAPAIRKATDFITSLVRKFDDTSPAVKGVIVVVGLLAASIAPLLIVIGLMGQGIGALAIAFGSISAPVLAVIGIVTLLGVVFKDEIVALFKGAMSWVQPIMDAFKYLTGGFDQSILDAQKYGVGVEEVIGSKAFKVVEIFNKLKEKIATIWTTIKETVTPIITAFVEIVKTIFTDLKAFWDEHGASMIEKFRSVWESVMGIVQPILQDMVAFIQEKLAMIKQFWDENGTQIMEAVKNVWNIILSIIQFIMPLIGFIVKEVWKSVKGVIDGALNFIMGLIKVFAGLFTGDWSKLWEGVKQLLKGAVQILWNVFNLLFIGKILGGIKAFAKASITKFASWGKSILSFFKGLWDNAVAKVKGFVDNSIEKINYFQQIGANIFQAIKQTITDAISAAKTKAVSLFGKLKDDAISRFNSLKSSVQSIFQKVKDFIQNPIKEAKETVLGIIDKIKNAFANMKIKIPKPKFPKVSVGKKKDAFFGFDVPTFKINWNAKGGIWNQPSLLGGGQGVGEAGAEAVLPIQHKRYMKPFAGAVAAHMDTLGGGGSNEPQVIENHVTTVIELDGEVVGRKTEKYVSRKQLDRQKRTNRGGR